MLQKLNDAMCERDYWERIRSDTSEAAALRAYLDQKFAKIFPQGKEEDLRPFISYLLKVSSENPSNDLVKKLLGMMHPDALAFLVRHGKSYRNTRWPEPPKIEPVPMSCFLNAHTYMKAHNQAAEDAQHSRRLVYVEGITFGCLSDPMLHAWNAAELSGDAAADYSHYAACEWMGYFGFAMTQEEYREVLGTISQQTGNEPSVRLIFRNGTFSPKIQECLEQIIAERQPSDTVAR